MDNEALKSGISSVLGEFSKLLIDHEENKKQQIILKKLLDNLRDELNLARDAERNADMKRSKSLEFVAQQQEVIVKLLHIKEENEQLKQTISLMEHRLVEIKISRLADQEKRDEEIHNIKQEYVRELLKVQEDGDLQVKKLEQDIDLEIQGLKSSIEVEKKKIVLQSNTINSLHAEIASMKEKSEKDLEAYDNKLAEQDKVYQAEMKTWKAAKSAYDLNDADSVREISRSGPLRPMQNNTFSECAGGNATYSGVSRMPEVNSYYRYQQLQNDLTQHYSGNLHDCLRAPNNTASFLARRGSTETTENQYRFQSNTGPQTYNDDFRQQQSNKLVPPFVENIDHQTPRSSANSQMQNGSVSRLPGLGSNYSLPSQTQTYPKLPLISKNRQRKIGSRAVRPLPRPAERTEENAGFRKAGELYLQENVDRVDGSADEPLLKKESDVSSEVEKSDRQKPKASIPAKRRKLYSELGTLL